MTAKGEEVKELVGKEQFDTLWTTFFDIYETLESFGSHLTKVSDPSAILTFKGYMAQSGTLLLLH